MVEPNFEKLINIWSGVTLFGLVLAAVGVFLFRHYSGKQNKQTASEINKRIEEASKASIKKINTQTDSIIANVGDTAKGIVSELGEKTNDAMIAIHNLEKDSKAAAERIQEKTNKIESQTDKMTRNSEYDITFLKVEYKIYSKPGAKEDDKPELIHDVDEVYKHFVNNKNYELVSDDTKYKIEKSEFERVGSFSLIVNGDSNLYFNNSRNTWEMGYQSLIVTYRFSLLGDFNLDLENFTKEGTISLLMCNKETGQKIASSSSYQQKNKESKRIKPIRAHIKFKNDKDWLNLEHVHSDDIRAETKLGDLHSFKISQN